MLKNCKIVTVRPAPHEFPEGIQTVPVPSRRYRLRYVFLGTFRNRNRNEIRHYLTPNNP